MAPSVDAKFIVVGAGLGGALVATTLGRAGYAVELYEMRHDLRVAEVKGGRSINLALSHRGVCALDEVGLAASVLEMAVPMRGRMIHAPSGRMTFQSYGTDATHVIHSVSRGGLNAVLLDAADRCDNVRLFFHHKCIDVDVDLGRVEFADTRTGETRTAGGGIVVSADGAFSTVRRAMQKLDRFDYRQDYLAHGYKELTIPPGSDGSHQMERHALHIWPRRSFMMIALPNADGSFTCTLFWPFEGPNGFDALKTEAELRVFFRREFPDAVPLMPALADDYFANPTSSLVTIRCRPWYYRDRVVLLGDACHAVVPFYGQGMNAAFEDVLVLSECLDRHKPNWERAFDEYQAARKKHVDVLAELALGNFIEMRDRTGSRWFLLKKRWEKLLHRLFPGWYLPLYNMVTHSRIPYADAVERARRQNGVVGIVLLILAMFVLTSLLWIVA